MTVDGLPMAAMARVLGEVVAERERQHTRWGQQDHDNPAWLAILTEEVGEAARAVVTERFPHAGPPGDLRAELVQVAAVACQWVEAIDRGRGVMPDAR